MIMVKDDYQIYLRIKSPSFQCGRLTYFTRTEIDKIGCFFFAENRFTLLKNRKTPKLKTTEKIKSVAEIAFTNIPTESTRIRFTTEKTPIGSTFSSDGSLWQTLRGQNFTTFFTMWSKPAHSV